MNQQSFKHSGSGRVSEARKSPDRIPSLDGVRAICITLVVVGHLSGTRGFGNLDLGIGDYAHLGVVVFFVVSGFLITSLLITEFENTRTISIKLFYARRSLRIFPASYFYLICVAGLWLAGIIRLRSADLWYAATYTVNYLPAPSWIIGHLWSLSVEEQFYLLWPLSFAVLGVRRVPWVAACVIVIGPLFRCASWFFLRGTPYRDLPIFPVVADSLAVGCLLASFRTWLESQSWYLLLFRPVWSASLLLLVLALNRYMGYTVVAVFGLSLINIFIAILIHRSICKANDRVGKILNWAPIAFLGGLSYSLYIWQQPFLNRDSALWICGFPQNLFCALATSLASFILLEKPFLKVRRRLRS